MDLVAPHGALFAFFGLVVLLWQFAVQVAATLVALWIWHRLRGRHAG